MKDRKSQPNAKFVRKLFEQVRRGELSSDAAFERLRHLVFEDLGFSQADHQGLCEWRFRKSGSGWGRRQLAQIFARWRNAEGNLLATRATEQQFAEVKKKFQRAECRKLARAIVLRRDEENLWERIDHFRFGREQRHPRGGRSALWDDEFLHVECQSGVYR